MGPPRDCISGTEPNQIKIENEHENENGASSRQPLIVIK
jgi:hypothetical protein